MPTGPRRRSASRRASAAQALSVVCGELERRELGRLGACDPQAQHVADERLCDGGDAGEHERHGEPEAVMGVGAAAQHPGGIHPGRPAARRP